MLVMLDAIHARLQPASTDFRAVWNRLSQRTTHDGDGAIWFLFLPVVDADLGEDLYIKMNSRGKPLTTFEVFKADFESIMKSVDPGRHRHLVDSMDGSWADTLWQYERRNGGDFKTDDEFERYLTFIIDICEWRDGAPERKWHDKATRRTWPIEKRAALAFADADEPERQTKPRLLLPCLRHMGEHRSSRRARATVQCGGCRGGATPAVLRDSRSVRCLHLHVRRGVLGTGDTAAVRCSARSAG